MKKNETINNNETTTGIEEVLKPTSLKNNWQVENKVFYSYYNEKEVKAVFRSKGKAIVVMANGDIIGKRIFSPESTIDVAEVKTYINITSSQLSELFPDMGEKERLNRIAGLMAGSMGIFGSSFTSCHSDRKRSGRYMSKGVQNDIANKLNVLLKAKGI